MVVRQRLGKGRSKRCRTFFVSSPHARAEKHHRVDSFSISESIAPFHWPDSFSISKAREKELRGNRKGAVGPEKRSSSGPEEKALSDMQKNLDTISLSSFAKQPFNPLPYTSKQRL